MLFSSLSRELSWQCKSLLRYTPRLRAKRGVRQLDAVTGKFSSDGMHRFGELQERYALSDWASLCSAGEFVENLYLLDLLDRTLDCALERPTASGAGLDIGCRNFSHLPALSAFFAADWIGVELDANARYLNGLTRRAYGEWMARQRPGCRYAAGSLLEVQHKVDLIVWILPFVLPAPLRHWGLPDRFFQPQALLQHAVSLLSDKGVMLVVNQGMTEAEAQQALFSEAGYAATPLGELHSVFSPFQQRRFGFLLRAENSAAS